MIRRPLLKRITLTVLTGLCATVVLANSKPIYDLTGTWTGTARSATKGHKISTLSGVFTTTDSTSSTFDGTITVANDNGPEDFDIKGTVSQSGTLKATLTPSPVANGTASVTGTINKKKNTISGTYRSSGVGDSNNDHGTFTLAKQPA